MIKIVVVFLAVISFHKTVFSASYYFSSASGDDLRTNAQAQNPLTPWKTLQKLQAIFNSLNAGDSILLKRGDTFEGNLFISKSGTSGLPIVISVYGNGGKPVISGFSSITAWNSSGSNIYTARLNAGAYLNMLTVNNVVMAMGRWPNTREPDKGYLTIDNNTKTLDGRNEYKGGSFTDAALPSLPDWTGAQAVIRKRHWVIDRCRITKHSGQSITYISPSHHDINNGWGYFIQNSPATLDRQGEWYYDPSAKTISIYSSFNPSAKPAVKAAVIDTLLYVNNKSFITFDNLVIQGSDTVSARIENNSSHITIKNCDFLFSGMRGIVANQSDNITIENCSFINSNNESILFNDCSYTTISNSRFKNIHLWRGMGEDNDGGAAVALVHETNSLVEYNTLDSLGSSGIAFLGSHITVKNNFVNNFTMVKDDGAGVYTWAGGIPGDIMTDRKITGNIVLNGKGAPEGTETGIAFSTNAFYVDDLGKNVEITGNTGANVSSSGLYLHNTQNILVRDNIFYNNKSTQLLITHDANGFMDLDKNPSNGRETEYPTKDLDVKNNILFAKTGSQGVLSLGTLSSDMANSGSYDSNYYVRPFDPNGIISTNYQDNGTIHSSYDLGGWKNKYGWDKHSKTSPVNMAPYKVSGTSAANKVDNGNFDTQVGSIEKGGACTLQWDNTKLDGGAVKVTGNDKNSIAELGANIDLHSTVAGTTYRVRFSLAGSSDLQNLVVYVRRWGGANGKDYKIISDIKYFKLGTGRSECEFFFTAPSSDPQVKLSLVGTGPVTPFWFDNVEVRPVQASLVNADDSIFFDVNPSKADKTIALTGTYKDIGGKEYAGKVTIKPFGSIVLF